MDNKQNIQGGELLESLKKLLFGGIDKLLDSAAEYEEEMGVLKQVTRIDLETKDGQPTGYTLTIKLAPVKGKTSTYYVEAETTQPNLDVSMLNKKVMKISNSSMRDFNNKIDEMLAANELLREKNDSQDESDSNVTDDAENNKSNSSEDRQNSQNAKVTDDQADEIDELIATVAEDFADHPIPANYKQGNKDEVVFIDVTVQESPYSYAVCEVSLEVLGVGGTRVDVKGEKNIKVEVYNETDGKIRILTPDELIESIEIKINETIFFIV